MVVRVVSDKPVKTKRQVCPKCGYELEYTGEDVKEVSSRDYTGCSDTYYYLHCPRVTCGEQISVSRYSSK
jgi:hypothetical protein